MSTYDPTGRTTWGGWRWGFLLMSVAFAALSLYLMFQIGSAAHILVMIPGALAAFLFGAALVASDEGLQRIVNTFWIFGL